MENKKSIFFLMIVLFLVNVFATDENLLPKPNSVGFEQYQEVDLDAYGIPLEPDYSIKHQFNNTSIQFESPLNRDFEDPIIINSFNIQNGVTALEFIDENLWGLFHGGELNIIDPTDGSIVTTIDLGMLYPSGITKYENFLIVTDKTNYQFVKIDIETLEVTEYIPTPVPEPNYSGGIKWDGAHFWHNDPRQSNGSSDNVTVKMDNNFQIIAEFCITNLFPGSNYPSGLTFDGQYLWLSENELDYIHRVNRDDFSVDRTIVWPYNYPNAITFDGQYLWVGDNATDMIYQLDINFISSIDNNVINTGKVNSLQNYPNPFNPTTTIEFSILNNSKVELSIYSIKGQKIKSLINDQISTGEHSVVWNGEDDSGKKVSSGVYLYKLIVDGNTEAVKKCLLLK